ncbi:hypothetical protein RD792_010679 [Penstemon davidsonii]|uniref:AT-rich interactive domain-containing protein 1-like n=1 Tax=Penstemon davidsonii TaxID=160366 RepID=A0ABR0D2T6_9LAMI|nr:hypothetical protein RD792_010679 [Penstemon davidsonii]
MAGWLKRVDGSGGVQESFITPQKFEKAEPFFDLESKRKLECEFNECLEVFLKQTSDISCFRPLPPVIGEGQEVDLFKLYIAVRKRIECGKDEISWSLVARDCGFDSKLGAALKLVYDKYLDELNSWVRKVVCNIEDENIEVRDTSVDFSSLLVKLESGMKEFLSLDQVNIEKDVDIVKFSDDDGKNEIMELSVDVKSVDPKLRDGNRIVNANVSKNQCGDDRVKYEDLVSRKRKRGCYMGMLNWVRKVAKDPCDPVIGILPQRNTWKHYESELEWKQILLAREAMLLRMNATSQQSIWQKKQLMHPSLYDDQYSSEKLRSSQRVVFAKDSSCNTLERLNSESSFSDYQGDAKRIRVGPLFQADLPQLLGSNYESDSKWLGTRIWPLEKVEQNKTSLIERDPIGKGRQESCGCQFPGSVECVRFHIKEKKIKVKLELGSAFYNWKFDGMGEEVALTWTKEEEKKFEKIVKSNRLSSEKYFWEELFKFFPRKGREALVSYYFNVFLLQRRGKQNRDSTLGIESDDEESEYGPVSNRFGRISDISPGSIFRSPKKSRLN